MAPYLEDQFVPGCFLPSLSSSLCCVHTVGGWPGLPFSSARLLLKREISTISNEMTIPGRNFLATTLPFPASLRNLWPTLHLPSLLKKNLFNPTKEVNVSLKETLTAFKTICSFTASKWNKSFRLDYRLDVWIFFYSCK